MVIEIDTPIKSGDKIKIGKDLYFVESCSPFKAPLFNAGPCLASLDNICNCRECYGRLSEVYIEKGTVLEALNGGRFGDIMWDSEDLPAETSNIETDWVDQYFGVKKI